MIHRIRVSRVLPDLSIQQVFVFRCAGTQADAEAMGHQLQTRWMEQNPGVPTVMVTDWPTPEELGDTHSFARPDYFTWKEPLR